MSGVATPVGPTTTLTDYVERVRLLVGDANSALHNYVDIVRYINEGREDCAGVTECLRQRLIVPTYQGQEVYSFLDSCDLSSFPGYGYVLNVKNIALVWGTYQFVLDKRAFSDYQAYVRNYSPQITAIGFTGTQPANPPPLSTYEPSPSNNITFIANNGFPTLFNLAEGSGYEYIPCVWAQVGQGTSGNAWMFPIPNSQYFTLWDCVCVPAPLTNNESIEAIPVPWTRAVPYYAAYRLVESLPYTENPNAVRSREMLLKRLLQQYQAFLVRGRYMASKGMTGSKYGRS